MLICKHCQKEITEENKHFRLKSVCDPCYRIRAKAYQRGYVKAGKYKHKQAEYKIRAKMQDMAEDKPKPKPAESKEDALFRRLLSRAIQSGHEKRCQIRSERYKKAMEY